MILFGGTFDPVHRGHIAAALFANKLLSAPIQMLLAPNPQLRPETVSTSFEHRWEMLNLACESHKTLAPCDVERHLPGPTRTIATLEHLKKTSQGSFVWLIGSDALAKIHLWHRAQELSEWLSFLVFKRQDSGLPQTPARFWQTKDATKLLEKPGKIYFVTEPNPMSAVTATTIRNRVQQGKDIKHLVPSEVHDYIISNHLYDQKDSC